MKILHFIYDDPRNSWCAGGGSIRVYEINKRLAHTHEITVITGNHPDLKNEVIDNITYRRIGSPAGYLISRLTYTLCAPWALWKHRSDLVVNDFSAFSPVFCELFTARTVINEFYHVLGTHAFKKYSLFGIFPWLAEKMLFWVSRNYITISPSVTQLLKQTADRESLIRCVYTGIAPHLFTAESRDGDYIAYIGRIDIYMKGLDTLLQAFSRMENKSVRLKIAGIGKEPDIAQMQQLIIGLGVQDRASYLGSLSEDEKRNFLSDAMCVAMPSRFEGWGIAAIEAQACGKAVVGTDIPGLKDAVRDGETGVLVPPDNPDALAGALDAVIADPVRRAALGARGKEWAARFDWDYIADDQFDFYATVLNERT